MTVLLRQRRHVGQLGGLNDGAALPSLDPTDLPVARNIEHSSDGAINKRPGRAVHAKLEAAAEPYCAPIASAVTRTDGTLKEGNYWVRVTYATGPGETDDLHSSDPANPGPAETLVAVGPATNSIQVSVPFHIRKAQVTEHDIFCQPDCPETDPQYPNCVPIETGSNGNLHRPEIGCAGGTVPGATFPTLDDALAAGECITNFKVTPGAVQVCDEELFKGWLVYSRSPRIQDEAHLGVNCEARDPLYHRTEPLGSIRQYDQATGTFIMNGGVDFGGGDCLDENTVDIMMPDRNGLPIRHFNVYVSQDGINFFYATSGVDGTSSVFVDAYDETATRAPSTRIERAAPAVEAVTVTDTVLGKCGEYEVVTGIDCGVYKVRYTWLTAEPAIVEDPGFPTAALLLDIPQDCPPKRCRQETWPSCAAYVCVDKGQGIQVTPPAMPNGVVGWQLYVEHIEPLVTLNMGDGQNGPALRQGDFNEFAAYQPLAFYFPDQDRDPFTDPTVLARKADLTTFPPIGDGSGTGNESGGSNSLAYENFGSTTNHDCSSEDTFDPSARGYRPGYEDIHDGFYNDRGEKPFMFASSRDTSDVNRMDFSFWANQDTTGSWTSATHACIKIRLRIREGRAGSFNPGVNAQTTLAVYDYSAGAFITLETGFPFDCQFHEYAFCVPLGSVSGGDYILKQMPTSKQWYLSVSLWAEQSIGFDVDNIVAEMIEQPTTVCGPLKILLPERGVYDSQVSGGAPTEFGAWYSGDSDLNDTQVEAQITPAVLDQSPFISRNTPWEEYDNDTANLNYQGTAVQYFYQDGGDGSNYQSLGAVGAGGGASYQTLGHTPDTSPCIPYTDFELRRTSDSFVYTSGTDYYLDRWRGRVYNIAIPDGTVVEVKYQIPVLVGGFEPRLPIPAANRGWLPSYSDLCRPGNAITGCYGEYAYLFSSSRENVARNRHHWWFQCEDADIGTATVTKMVVQVTFRARSGGSGGEGSWSANQDTSRVIRVWDDNAAGWINLEQEIASTTNAETGGFVTKRWAITWDPNIRLNFNSGPIIPLYDPIANPRNFIIVDMKAWDYNGFDVADVCVELWEDLTDPVINTSELLQADRLPDGAHTLQNPLVEKPVLKDGTVVGAQGQWTELYANTTPQWPTTCYSAPIVGDDGVEKEVVTNFIGCADSVFRDEADGTLLRVYHVEGRWWNRSMRHDWRFTNYMWRLFFCNPGLRSWNLRFDGKQTHPMGLAWPALDWDEATDESGNYIPPGANDPDPTGLQDGCEIVGEQPLGRIVDVTDIDVDPDEPTPEGVVCWDVEYYLVAKRVLGTPQRSYVVRSRPRKLTETRQICGDDDTDPIIRIEFEYCPEPQTTHIEIYRNQANTAEYFLVEEIELNQAIDRMCDPNDIDFDAGPEGRLVMTFEDQIPIEDDDITLPAEFETGRPPPAINLLFHRGRVWFVQQEERELLSFTNVTSPSGALNPEGFDLNHVIDPPMAGASAILSLSPYHSVLLAHGDNGIVGVTGLSDGTNGADGLQASALAADAGAIGPDAWVNVDNIQYLMTRKGPAMLTGDELVYLSHPIEGSLGRANLRSEVGYASRCTYYRTRGRSQVWFTHTEDQFGEMNRVWLFDENVRGVGDRAQIWKVFTEMPVHGLCSTEDGDGEEFPLMGGCRGRLYRHGRGATDAGLFIEFEVHTKPFDEGEFGRSIQPRWAYWHSRGDHGDVFFVDVRKDYEAVNINPEIRIPLGGGAGVYWNDGWYNPSGSMKWQASELRPYLEQRMSMGQFFRQIQFVISQDRERWPPGHKRAATFECAGYDIFFRMLGPRPAQGPR